MEKSKSEKKKSYSIDMLHGALLPKILLFCIPLALSGILQLLEKNGFALAVAPVGRCAARRCCGGHAASRMRARNPDGSEFTPSRSRVPARTLRARSFRKARDD